MCEQDLNWVFNDLAVGNIRAGADLVRLQALGFSAVVCAIPELPIPIDEYKTRKFSLFHIPIDDHPQVDIQRWFNDVVRFIMNNHNNGIKTFVHCHAGISRSTTLCVAFVMNLFKCNDVRAIFWVKSKRPCTNINPGFLKQLKEYAQQTTIQ